MAYENSLYPYKVKIKCGEEIEEITGHSPTQGEARKHIQTMIKQRKQEGVDEAVVAFEFNGKEVAVG